MNGIVFALSSVWDEEKVAEWGTIAMQAKGSSSACHVGRIFSFCREKTSELAPNDPRRKFKGRVVFQGNQVKDQNWNTAMFQELSSCPAAMEAAKAADGYGLIPGHDTQRADAVMAYTHPNWGVFRHGFDYPVNNGLRLGPNTEILFVNLF